jgi:tetratricopeptide (TPR) repeat protein
MKTFTVAFIAIILLLLSGCHNNGRENVGTTESGKSAYPQNIQILIAAVGAQPDSNRIRKQLAWALDSIGDYANAFKQIDTAVTKDTGNNVLWINRGNIAEDAGDTLAALESYVKALHIYETPDALLWLAKLYAETKNPRALLIASRIKVLGLGKEYDAHSAYVAGVYYARTGKKQEALQKFDECIAYNYTYMEAYIEKGMVYFDNKQYRDALNVFQFAATVNELNADAYYYQAKCYESMQKKDSAVQEYKQSLSLDKGLKEAHEGLKRLGAE